MNSSEVANHIGVSQSTILRWVKQIGLPLEKNERGHYLFSSNDIEQLKEIQEQIQKGILLQDISFTQLKQVRKGLVRSCENEFEMTKLESKLNNLETRLNSKADSVTSYQLLQHRNEIEELQNHIAILVNRIESLEKQIKPLQNRGHSPEIDTLPVPRKSKRNGIVNSIFGF